MVVPIISLFRHEQPATTASITHTPSGLRVTASDQRSQLQNKKLATERLLIKLAAWKVEQTMQVAQENWSNHTNLQRGNPVKTIQESLR